ncbi:hypothetical protein SAE02_69130 [Skermanella aerolata]|uniref:Helix-turn-helix domain-containing protein n=1 Tax=Skermanella aerolata TaxID=393310 RepID=A0A512E227_9PROT|nr:hypothetical protein [Skermanella aerolata]GEO42765.1 hypothetical protein SAE02_69130 [Skermanella aerolata]
MANISCGSCVPIVGNVSSDQPWRRAFYSIEQIKTLASISRTTIYREAKAGRLKLSKLAGRTGVMDGDFISWLAMGEEIKQPPTDIDIAGSEHNAARPGKLTARHLPPPPRRGLLTSEVNAPSTSQQALRRLSGTKR